MSIDTVAQNNNKINNNYGFIITRHVNSEKTNRYWNECVRCIRRFYPYKKIVIIDDNSDQSLVKEDLPYKNIEIIQSEFPGRGELLPYYYFYKRRFFENAVIIHESIFFHKRVNFEKIIGVPILPLWHFQADKENIQNTNRIVHSLKNYYDLEKKINLGDDIVLGMNRKKWIGCFGVQSFISYRFLNYLQNYYHIFNMLNVVHCRADRCCLERIMGVIFCQHFKQLIHLKSMFGNITQYMSWGYTFDEYEQQLKNKKVIKPVVKVWTGR